MAAAFAYIVSNNAPGDAMQANWAWRGENGQDRGIAPVVGQRTYIQGAGGVRAAPTARPTATLRPGQPTPTSAVPTATPFPSCQLEREFFDPFLNRCRMPDG